MSAFQFTIPAPVIKCDGLPSYQAALLAWRESVTWAITTHPACFAAPALAAPSATPALAAPAPSAAPGAEKGPWELQALEKGRAQALLAGKRAPKSIRFTSRLAALYATKEDYCQAIMEGKETGAESEDERCDTAPAFVSPESVPPLF